MLAASGVWGERPAPLGLIVPIAFVLRPDDCYCSLRGTIRIAIDRSALFRQINRKQFDRFFLIERAQLSFARLSSISFVLASQATSTGSPQLAARDVTRRARIRRTKVPVSSSTCRPVAASQPQRRVYPGVRAPWRCLRTCRTTATLCCAFGRTNFSSEIAARSTLRVRI